MSLISHDQMAQALSEWGVRHFTAKELLFLGSSADGSNNAPPLEFLENIKTTICAVERLRRELDVPIGILSAYRSREYNSFIGGVPKSQHLHFKALDIQSNFAGAEEMFSVLSAYRDQGYFTGGLGLYKSFVHVDSGREHNATWRRA